MDRANKRQHHRDAVADLGGDAQAARDEEDSEIEAAAHIVEQLAHLGMPMPRDDRIASTRRADDDAVQVIVDSDLATRARRGAEANGDSG